MEWLAGTVVRWPGVYRVTHRGHRPTHEAILRACNSRGAGIAVRLAAQNLN